MIRPKNASLLDGTYPFVVATKERQEAFELAPFGIEVAPEHRYDPLKSSSVPFREHLCRLDERTFGEVGMPMPRWVFYNGSELPGGIAGLGIPRSEAPASLIELLEPGSDYDDLLPIAMYIAIPTHEAGVWLGHNLASLGGHLTEGDWRGLGSLTKALGLAIFRAAFQIGVTQWASKALSVHTALGPLELLSAWTPAHSDPSSLTYRAVVDKTTMAHLARDVDAVVTFPTPTLWIHSEDHPAQQDLQKRLEAGERYALVGKPKRDETGQSLPIAALPPAP